MFDLYLSVAGDNDRVGLQSEEFVVFLEQSCLCARGSNLLFCPWVAGFVPITRADDFRALCCEEVAKVGESATESEDAYGYV